MKKIFSLFLLFCVLIIFAVYFFAAPKAEEKITSALEGLGAKNVTIENTSVNLGGLTIDKITLDKDGFNELKNVKADIHWLRFLSKSQINDITIEEVNISSTARELRRNISRLKHFDVSHINQIPINNISIQSITLNVATTQKALRFKGNSKIYMEDNERVFKAQIEAEQYDVAFKSHWEGKLSNDSKVTLNGKFEELKINNNFMQINRGDGWISYLSEKDQSTLSGQVDAGSGNIFNVPAKNISLVLGQEKETYPILLRAEAAGRDDVFLTVDYTYAHDVAQRNFKSTLKATNLKSFLKNLQNTKLIPSNENLDDLESLPQNLFTSIDYMPEKRFAGGPLPFDVKVDKHLEGTFLIYPDSFDIRGTLETKNNFLSTLNALFDIPEENIVEDTIRIDGNLQSLMN